MPPSSRCGLYSPAPGVSFLRMYPRSGALFVNAVVPALGGPMFFFYTDDGEGMPGFSPSFMGLLSVVGSICSLAAIVSGMGLIAPK